MGRKKGKLGMVLCPYIPSNEMGEEGPEVQGHPWLRNKLKKPQPGLNKTLIKKNKKQRKEVIILNYLLKIKLFIKK